MAPYAAQAASAAGFPAERLRLVSGAAEAMPFPDGAFDAAVVTLVR